MLTAEPRRTVSKEGRTMSFGEQLRKRREELGISRAELADRLGVSRSAIGNYETGVSAPKEEVLLRLFDALGVDPTICIGTPTGPMAAFAPTRSRPCWRAIGG